MPILDFNSKPCVYMKNIIHQKFSPTQTLLMQKNDKYGKSAIEEKLYLFLTIESIYSLRESIHKIFMCYTPIGHEEEQIYSLERI